MQDAGSGPLKKVTLLQAGESSEAIYDEWARSYETDLLDDFGYVSPTTAARALAAAASGTTRPVLDVGCGTGLVGAALHGLGFTRIDGVDYSAGMLEQARAKGCYRSLVHADLTAPLDIDSSTYAAMICVGVMGAGHLVPEHFAALFRTVEPGGPIVLYGNATPYDEDGYAQRFAAIDDWVIERTEVSNYMTSITRRGVMVVGRRTV